MVTNNRARGAGRKGGAGYGAAKRKKIADYRQSIQKGKTQKTPRR